LPFTWQCTVITALPHVEREKKNKSLHKATSQITRRCEKINQRSGHTISKQHGSIYEKVPLYKVVKAWDNTDPNLSEVYKLQSNDSRNKSCIKIHKDNGKYGIKFTINKTIPELNKGAEKCDLNWSDSFVELKNVLQGHHKTAWKQVLHERFPEPVNAMVPVPATQDCSPEENFHQAIQLFIQ
jgi:hypothetical protein